MLTQFGKIGGLRREGEFAVFVAAKVEHIVEQAEQLIPRLTYPCQRRILLSRQRSTGQPLQQAEHGVHRRADLVADGGQKAPLGQNCLLRLLMGVLQCLILLDPGSGILHHRIDPPTLRLTAATAIELQPAQTLGRMVIAHGECEGFACLQHGEHLTLHPTAILALQQLKHPFGLTTDLLTRQPQQLVTAPADKLDTPYPSLLEHKLQHHAGDGIGQGAQAALCLTQKTGLLTQHTDIRQGDEIGGGCLLVQPQRMLGIGEDLIPQHQLPFTLLRLNRRQHQLLRIAQGQTSPLFVGFDHLALAIAQIDGHRQRLKHGFPQLALDGQRLLGGVTLGDFPCQLLAGTPDPADDDTADQQCHGDGAKPGGVAHARLLHDEQAAPALVKFVDLGAGQCHQVAIHHPGQFGLVSVDGKAKAEAIFQLLDIEPFQQVGTLGILQLI